MFFLPASPRWLAMKHRDDDVIASLSKLRRLAPDHPELRAEFLEIKAAVMFDEEVEAELKSTDGRLGPWKALFGKNMMKRVAIGCLIMIFQQFTGTLFSRGCFLWIVSTSPERKQDSELRIML
jgi:hypothetical protein